MGDAKVCPNCQTHLHPQDLDDLYRGRKLTCQGCGFELRASANRAAAVIGGLLIAGLPWLLPWLLLDGRYWVPVVLAMLAAALVSAFPPGLIAGAPWVVIRAEEPPHREVERRFEKMNANREKLRD
ncbi:MAG: hypothetical protein JJU31_09785 [Wenzhouxiangella sp.]|nr:hypothetical protein [Wenzhouxiangella sp.]MCH8477802.1 hypothetical protein [Wenzhouxiangella sp.]